MYRYTYLHDGVDRKRGEREMWSDMQKKRCQVRVRLEPTRVPFQQINSSKKTADSVFIKWSHIRKDEGGPTQRSDIGKCCLCCADSAGILNRSFVKATWEIMSCDRSDRIRMGRDWLQEKLDQAERKRDKEKSQYYPHVTFLHM